MYRRKKSFQVSKNMFTSQDSPRLVGLIYLTAIYHTGSKRKTAESLGTSVDKINKYLQFLEAGAGGPLFINTGHGSVISPNAQKLLESGLKVEEAIRQLDPYFLKKTDLTSEVSICLAEGCSLELLPPNFLDNFLLPHGSKLKIFFHDEISVFCPRYNDIILSTSPIHHKDFCQIYSREIPCSFYASQSYIKSVGMPQNWEDLLNNHCIINKSYDHVLGWKEIATKAKKISCETNSFTGLLRLMNNGNGIGIMPDLYNHGSLVPIDTINSDLRMTINLMANLCTKDSSEMRPIINAISDYLKNI